MASDIQGFPLSSSIRNVVKVSYSFWWQSYERF